MATLKLSSEFLEYELTEAELLTAKSLRNAEYTKMWLQNRKMEVVAQLNAFTFGQDTREADMLQHAYLRGLQDQLAWIIDEHNQAVAELAQAAPPSQSRPPLS